MKITNQIPGGNIRVLSQNGNQLLLEQEQRDSPNEWFYWKFKAEFPEAGEWTFEFTCPNKVGTRGPCISFDQGKSWQWQSKVLYPPTDCFSYKSSGKEEVWFCQALPYMLPDWEHFLASHPGLSVSTLAVSKKGRNVPLAVLKKGTPKCSVLLAARHHCQESMASFVLEGFLEAALYAGMDDCAVYAVPFADLDGVEEGDQGKGRVPRDHGRDYAGESLFPECAAIRKLAAEVKPFVIFDLHCPWLRAGFNEAPYFVESSPAENRMEIDRMARCFEAEAPAKAPFFRRDTMRWGVGWNNSANGTNCTLPGIGLSKWGTLQPFTKLSVTLETPFANFREHTVTEKEARAFGTALFRAFRRYRSLAEHDDDPQERRAQITFTGDIMCRPEQTAACTLPDGKLDYSPIFASVKELLNKSDYTVGNLETCFAGVDAGYSQKLYSFNTPDCFGTMLKDAGFDLVSTAMNHCLDRDLAGLKRTLDVLDSQGIEHTGTARSADERNKVFLRNINGIKIAFISYTYGTNAFANKVFLKEKEKYAVNLLQAQETLPGSIHLLNPPEQIVRETAALPREESAELKQLAQDIADAKAAGADMTIILLHCGGQYNEEPDAYTKFIVKKLQRFGADLVIGNHPHRIQKWKLIGNMPVFYCLGNLTSTPGKTPESLKNPFSDVSMILHLTLTKKQGKTRVTAAEFNLVRSVILPDGKSVVKPLTQLIQENRDGEQQKTDLRKVLRILSADQGSESGVPQEENGFFHLQIP